VLSKEFSGIRVKDKLEIQFFAKTNIPVISGVEIVMDGYTATAPGN